MEIPHTQNYIDSGYIQCDQSRGQKLVIYKIFRQNINDKNHLTCSSLKTFVVRQSIANLEIKHFKDMSKKCEQDVLDLRICYLFLTYEFCIRVSFTISIPFITRVALLRLYSMQSVSLSPTSRYYLHLSSTRGQGCNLNFYCIKPFQQNGFEGLRAFKLLRFFPRFFYNEIFLFPFMQLSIDRLSEL